MCTSIYSLVLNNKIRRVTRRYDSAGYSRCEEDDALLGLLLDRMIWSSRNASSVLLEEIADPSMTQNFDSVGDRNTMAASTLIRDSVRSNTCIVVVTRYTKSRDLKPPPA
jgi:hypothetical protein